MIKLLSKVKADAKKKRITNLAIASGLKVSHGMVSNYFNDEHRISGVNFCKLLTMVYEDQLEVIDQRILEYVKKSSKTEHILEILEWCQYNGKKPIQKQILSNTEGFDEPIFEFYELFLKRNDKSISANQFYVELENIKYKSNKKPGFKALGWIGLLYAYYDLNNFNMFFIANEGLKQINEMKNRFLNESFKVRVYELQAVGAFKENKIDVAIEAAKAITECPNIKLYPMGLCSMLLLLSEMYVFEDYKKSISYIEEAFQIFNKILDGNSKRWKLQLEATYDFIKISNGDYQNLFLSSPAEKAHYLASIGGEENVNQCLEILNQLEKENGSLSAFQHYYKALALKNVSLMNEVKDLFIQNGDIFYSQLPKRAILKM